MRISAILVLAAVSAVACRSGHETAAHRQAAPPSREAARVLQLITAVGRDSVVRLYANQEGCGEALADSIATGDSVWLEVSDRLEPRADGCFLELLDYGDGMALLTSPRHVLTLQHRPGLPGLCMSPLIEPPDSEDHSWYVAARRALKGVRQSDLADSVRLCEQLIALGDSGKQPWEGLRCDTSGWARREVDTLSLGSYLTLRVSAAVTLDTSALARLMRDPGGARWTGQGMVVEYNPVDSAVDSAIFNRTKPGLRQGATGASTERRDSLPRPPSGWLGAWSIYNGSPLYDVELFTMLPRSVRVIHRVHIYACAPAGAPVAQQVARSLAWVH